MFGIIALAAAVVFVVLAVYRFVPSALPQVGPISFAAAVIGGLSGIAHWHDIGDTRWLVGAILMLVGVVLAMIGAGNRTLRFAGVVFGALGALLFVVALTTGFPAP
jgi:uncharacterized membrane protein YfcA